MEPVVAYVEDFTQSIVFSGVFAGMKLSKNVPWSQYDRPAKLLGTYEEEIHPYIRIFQSRGYDVILDVGHAEGYYAIGLALIFPDADVYAYDTHEAAKSVCAENASINGVEDRVLLRNFCDAAELRARVQSTKKRAFVLCDCEGYESELFSDPGTLNDLALTDLIIECHDFLIDGITIALSQRFSISHDVTVVSASGRNPSKFEPLKNVADVDRWRAVCENRPAVMSWIICRSRS